MSLLIFSGLTPVFAARFAHSTPAKLAARKRWTALSKLLREIACFQSHAASATDGSRGPQRPENDPVDHFQRGRAGRPRSGLPSLVGFGAKPQRNLFSSNFCFSMTIFKAHPGNSYRFTLYLIIPSKYWTIAPFSCIIQTIKAKEEDAVKNLRMCQMRMRAFLCDAVFRM